MEKYAPGMRLLIRDEEWMVRKVETNSLGNKALYCVGVSPLVKDREAVFLSDLEDIVSMSPTDIKLVPDDSPHFIKTKLYLESQWRQKIPTDQNIHVGHKAVMDTMAFQLEPAKIALKQIRQRILIADTVGLGKTLEAGILMSELIARGKGKRILVVTVKSMMAQFQKEMWNRFTIPLVRLDSKMIQKINETLPINYNPFFYHDKAIISIDTLKRDVQYRTHLENAYWDIIVIDEAHNVAARGDRQAQRSRLAELLAERSDTMIMLSATPHDGRQQSFASLMQMLDKTAIPDVNDYTSEDIKGLCIRRFKKDVKDQLGDYQERKVSVEKCRASSEEERVYDLFADMHLEMDDAKPRGAGQLFKTSLEKALFSSPAACLKSIEERLKKLKKKYPNGEMADIQILGKLYQALEKIKPEDFSRYQQLLSLMRNKDYNWEIGQANDRLVIFTERIETMKYLAEHLRKDLNLSEEAVKTISGSDSDIEQQRIVENFGRGNAPVRILVASDVASEGLNLHYTCHRLIHFDIPWSLMVFQQRNGRVDRIGQKEQADIRYFLIQSENKKIKGDTRILEILMKKEKQAYDNIGDPALLMGKFNESEEVQIVASAIENGISGDDFSRAMELTEKEFDPLEFLMGSAADSDNEDVDTVEDHTLFRDKEYLYEAMKYFNTSTEYPVEKLQLESGLKICLTSDLTRRLGAVLPKEALPKDGYIILSDNVDFCVNSMRRSMQNTMQEDAWPEVQYLWRQHPIFRWVNDKAGLIFSRNEAPIIGMNTVAENKILYIISASIPNRKSTPLVDEWFGVEIEHGRVSKVLSMDEVLHMIKLRRDDIPNRGVFDVTAVAQANQMLKKAVAEADKYMQRAAESYQREIQSKLDQEISKLAGLEERHKDVQLSLFKDEGKKAQQERKVSILFDKFYNWVNDTLTIQKDNPYIRIIAVVIGVA